MDVSQIELKTEFACGLKWDVKVERWGSLSRGRFTDHLFNGTNNPKQRFMTLAVRTPPPLFLSMPLFYVQSIQHNEGSISQPQLRPFPSDVDLREASCSGTEYPEIGMHHTHSSYHRLAPSYDWKLNLISGEIEKESMRVQ